MSTLPGRSPHGARAPLGWSHAMSTLPDWSHAMSTRRQAGATQ
ncbi:hypothetical protein [Corallococcus sp. CA047B]|nr:hypothetical protein [Corallococcus sp. CA047B]